MNNFAQGLFFFFLHHLFNVCLKLNQMMSIQARMLINARTPWNKLLGQLNGSRNFSEMKYIKNGSWGKTLSSLSLFSHLNKHLGLISSGNCLLFYFIDQPNTTCLWACNSDYFAGLSGRISPHPAILLPHISFLSLTATVRTIRLFLYED